ncbi:MAG: hypothetical protein AB7S81_07510 [Bdellovibrionales bacterium]
MLNDIAYILFLLSGCLIGLYTVTALEKRLLITKKGSQLLKNNEVLFGLIGYLFFGLVVFGAILLLQALFGTGYPH